MSSTLKINYETTTELAEFLEYIAEHGFGEFTVRSDTRSVELVVDDDPGKGYFHDDESWRSLVDRLQPSEFAIDPLVDTSSMTREDMLQYIIASIISRGQFPRALLVGNISAFVQAFNKPFQYKLFKAFKSGEFIFGFPIFEVHDLREAVNGVNTLILLAANSMLTRPKFSSNAYIVNLPPQEYTGIR